MRGRHVLVVVSVALLLGISVPSSLEAGTKYNVSGTNYKWREADAEVTDLPDGRQVRRVQNAGFHVNEKPANYPVPMVKQQCRGTNYRSADGKRQTGWGYCDFIDADGDVYWEYWYSTGVLGEPGSWHGSWTVIGGVGKFEGIKGSGTWKNTGARLGVRAWTETFEGTMELP